MNTPPVLRFSALAMVAVFAVLFLSKSANASITCTRAGLTDPSCTLEQPYCSAYEFQRYECLTCSPGSLMAGGGSCMCNANTSYCESGDAGLGQCKPYTILNSACTKDTDCQTTQNNLARDNVPQQYLFCVQNKCKPCSPSIWTQYNIGGASGVYACAGYSGTLSTQAGRYVTSTATPGVSFTCQSDGSIVIVNPTIDYNYQYGGDHTQWPNGRSGSTTASASATTGATASTLSKSTTAAAAGPSAATTTTKASVTTGNVNGPAAVTTTTATVAGTPVSNGNPSTVSSTTKDANAQNSGAASLRLSRWSIIASAVLVCAAISTFH